jgi:hypothetical protein
MLHVRSKDKIVAISEQTTQHLNMEIKINAKKRGHCASSEVILWEGEK